MDTYDRQQSLFSDITPPSPGGLLQRLIGKPASVWTVDDLIDVAREKGIRRISLMHVGGDGWLKALDFAPRSEGHLRDILEGGERADGSSLFYGTGISPDSSDVMVRPRISGAFLDPFSTTPGLAILCGHFGRDGQPLPESPDTILRRATERLRMETGADLLALGEVEYFLGKRADERDVYGADDRGYHATSPFVYGESLRRRTMHILSDIGVPVKYGHSEVGYIEADEADGLIWEQHEIELGLARLPKAAESVVLAHWVLRKLAHENRMQCSFEPIMMKGHPGSGMHFHLSPVRNGVHLGGAGEDESMSDEARWLIGGLVQMGSALMSFGNRREGSFVRLIQGLEAPNTVTWGAYNRHALIRLPIQARTSEGRIVSPPTIEFRLPDGSAHPFLLLAGIAQAMLFGRACSDLDETLARTHAAEKNGGAAAATPVPGSFGEIADRLDACRDELERGDVFPGGFITAAIERLRQKDAAAGKS
jgi:glutamine synthetase